MLKQIGTMIGAKANEVWYHITGNIAHAGGIGGGGISGGGTVDTGNAGLNTIITYILTGLAAAGIIFVVIGGVGIATAIKSGEQNPEAITGAVKNLLVGGLLIGLAAVVNLLK